MILGMGRGYDTCKVDWALACFVYPRVPLKSTLREASFQCPRAFHAVALDANYNIALLISNATAVTALPGHGRWPGSGHFSPIA